MKVGVLNKQVGAADDHNTDSLFEPAERRALVDAIHACPGMIVLSVTGGGMASITDLMLVPGASRTILELSVPYSGAALAQLIGTEADGAVSPDTARLMARACWVRARQLCPDEDVPVFGIACTAALVTDRDRRGEDRACLASASAADTQNVEVVLNKRSADAADVGRVEQDRVVADRVLALIASTLGATPA